MAALIGAVAELIGEFTTGNALANLLGIFGEIHRHAAIKDIERAFPMGLIAKLISIAHDAAIDLINLFKAAVDHHS